MLEDNLVVIMDSISAILNTVSTISIDDSQLEQIIELIQKLPNSITNSDLFLSAENINEKTTYEEILWITSDDITYVNTEKPERYIQSSFDVTTKIGEYINKIALDDSLGKREKIVILLSHFESYLHSKTSFDHGLSIKNKFRDAVIANNNYTADSIALAITYAIVRVVYSNTINYPQFDKRIPHRNDILHNGTIAYSDEEIETAYNSLLAFICIIDSMFI